VLPLFGPSSLRDAPGMGLDLKADVLGRVSSHGPYYGAVATADQRQQLPADRLLDAAALDRYSFVRDGYLQRRRSLISDGNPDDPE
jgi:phospholipid-binding lipoprotein MlaA